MAGLWKKIRTQLEITAAHLFGSILPQLPRAGLLHFADWMGNLVFALDQRGRELSLENLEVAFPGRWLPAEKMEVARTSYRHLARTFFDLFWLAGRTPQTLRDIVTIKGLEEFRAGKTGLPGESGVMFFGAHLGNFEVLSMVMGTLQMPSVAVGQDIKNPAITPFFVEARTRYGIELIPKNRAGLRMFKALKRGKNCGFLVDLTLKLDEPGTLIECFGKKKWVTSMHVALSRKTGARMVPLVCLPVAEDRYEFRFMPEMAMDEKAAEQELVQRCWDLLEPVVRERPECWMWNYKHWRYRPEQEEDYPIYAKSGKRFEKILRS